MTARAGKILGRAAVRTAGLRRGLPAVLSFFLAFAAVGVLATSAGSSAAPLEVVAKEFLLIPKDMIARTGDVTLLVRNQGTIEHNLIVEVQTGQPVAKIAVMEPGETWRVKVSLRAGTYRLYCSLPGHLEAGMVATLRVDP